MSDSFNDMVPGLESPASNLANVTPNDTTDLSEASRAINVATSGFVHVTTVSGDDAIVFIAAGSAFPVRAERIWATGTTATGIVVMS